MQMMISYRDSVKEYKGNLSYLLHVVDKNNHDACFIGLGPIPLTKNGPQDVLFRVYGNVPCKKRIVEVYACTLHALPKKFQKMVMRIVNGMSKDVRVKHIWN